MFKKIFQYIPRFQIVFPKTAEQLILIMEAGANQAIEQLDKTLLDEADSIVLSSIVKNETSLTQEEIIEWTRQTKIKTYTPSRLIWWFALYKVQPYLPFLNTEDFQLVMSNYYAFHSQWSQAIHQHFDDTVIQTRQALSQTFNPTVAVS